MVKMWDLHNYQKWTTKYRLSPSTPKLVEQIGLFIMQSLELGTKYS